jgi:hypothetical protein
VLLINCPIRAKVTANGDIHAFDSGHADLFSNGTLNIYSTKYRKRALKIKSFNPEEDKKGVG